MVGLTAAAEYGFDVDKLTPVARRVGPTPADLGHDTIDGLGAREGTGGTGSPAPTSPR